MLSIRQLVGAVLALAQGIHGVMTTAQDFREWEQRFQAVVQAVAGLLLRWAWERLDDRLLAERDRQWKCVNFKTRTLITVVGEITVRRRLYRHRKTGAYRFLLDEALGWQQQARLSPRLGALAVAMSTELSFRQTSRWLGELVPGVSSMTVWRAAQNAGQELDRQLAADRAALQQGTLASRGTQPVPNLRLEGDGVFIPLQHAPRSRGEVKLVAGYSGKRQQGARCALTERRVAAGMVDAQTIWDDVTVTGGQVWDWASVETVAVGGDGAAWVRKAGELFPNARYHLDPFHLRRALTEGLRFSPEHYEAVTKALGTGDFDATMVALDAAVQSARGKARHRARRLQHYITNQWDGIAALPKDARLGAIEGQVRHVLTYRLKHIGARWTPAGGHHMARLLAARANGELEQRLKPSPVDLELMQAALKTPIEYESARDTAAEDLGSWLQAHVPALDGPHASRPWIKHTLREITRVLPVA
jgi:hypothetical protein